MPVTQAQLGPSILAQMKAQSLVGAFNVNLSSAIAQAVQSYVATLSVQTVATGTLGAGTGTGKWLVDPVSGARLLDASLVAAGLPGANRSKVAMAVAYGVAGVINTSAITQTVVTGVAVGAETGTVTGGSGTVAASLLLASLTAFAVIGPKAGNLATGLGQGLSLWLATGAVTGVVAGAPVSPFPASAGTGLGRVI